MRCCSDAWRARWPLARGVAAGACLAAVAGAAAAHKASDAYLQLAASPGRLELRWDIALRDLDVALDLDGDADGKLTWGEVRTVWPRIESYALPRLSIEGCALVPAGRGLERRSDGAYAVLRLQSDCTLARPARIAYGLFADVDPTHRGIAKVQHDGQEVALAVLEPNPSMTAASVGGSRSVSTVASASAAAHSGPAAAPAALWQFFAEGMRHIATGYDHVLFLLCLLLPSVLRRTPAGAQPVARLMDAVWPVAGIVTAFTVAHSITLGLAALQLVSLSPSVIEPAIAATIVLAALDNVLPIFPVRRVVVAFFFGLVHGFGFAGVLGELALPRADFAWALLQFNLGIEAGQLAIVIVVTTVLFALRRWPGYGRIVVGGGSAAAIAIGVVWLIERTADVSILAF
ncbi:MAG: HupE/UreJ family protein [Caldimonas sp.]